MRTDFFFRDAKPLDSSPGPPPFKRKSSWVLPTHISMELVQKFPKLRDPEANRYPNNCLTLPPIQSPFNQDNVFSHPDKHLQVKYLSHFRKPWVASYQLWNEESKTLDCHLSWFRIVAGKYLELKHVLDAKSRYEVAAHVQDPTNNPIYKV